jgi:hypothetical protein
MLDIFFVEENFIWGDLMLISILDFKLIAKFFLGLSCWLHVGFDFGFEVD